MKQKLGDNKKKRFYSEIWQNAVWGRGGGGGGRCENPVGLSMCEGCPMEAVFIKSCVPFER